MKKLTLLAILLYIFVVFVDAIQVFLILAANPLATFDVAIFLIQVIILTPIYIYGVKKSADYLSSAFETVRLHKDILLPGVLVGVCIALAVSYLFIFLFVIQLLPGDSLDAIIEPSSTLNFMEPTSTEYWWSVKFFLVMMGFLTLMVVPPLMITFVRNRLSLSTIFMVKDADDGKDPSLLKSYRKVSKKMYQDLTLLRGLLTATVFHRMGGPARIKTSKVDQIIRPIIMLTPIIAVYKNQTIKESFLESLKYYKHNFYESIFGGMFFGNMKYLVYILISIGLVSAITLSPLFLEGGLSGQADLITIAMYDLVTIITLLSIYYIYAGTLESLETVYFIRLFQRQEGLPVKKVENELVERVHRIIENNKDKIKNRL